MSNADAIEAVLSYCKSREIVHGGYKGIRDGIPSPKDAKATKVVYLIRSNLRKPRGSYQPYSFYYVDELSDGSIRVEFGRNTKTLPEFLLDAVN